MERGFAEDLGIRAAKEISEEMLSRGKVEEAGLIQIRRSVCEKYHLASIPTNSSILSALPDLVKETYRPLLQTKPVRTASGIAVITVMSRPFPCPHGTCVYCPGGIFFGTPQSYLGTEPGVQRAKELDFDSFKQVQARMVQMEKTGHRTGKAEVIVIGGTFLSFPRSYQTDFIKGCFDGLNGFEAPSLEEAKRYNEQARVRNVGLTIETKPDFCRREHIDTMLSYGATRVEIGVQSLRDEVYRLVNRGHTFLDVVEAFRVARDAGYKLVAHMMPGLPGSTPEQDFEDFRTLFHDARFMPDMLKIYPTLVVPGTGLHGWFKAGRYQPYNLETVIRLLADVKRIAPRWLRIMRIQREISAHEIAAGVRRSNLRELVLREVHRRGEKCRCIRCREIGLLTRRRPLSGLTLGMRRESFTASDGREFFLSWEDDATEALVGFLRLRIPSEEAHRPEIRGAKAALVRELHVYGTLVPVGERDTRGWQHKGYGAMLMEEAERIAFEESGLSKVVIISAVGTREYYRKLGYHLEGPYMVKARAG